MLYLHLAYNGLTNILHQPSNTGVSTMNVYNPHFGLSDAAIAYAIDLANGDVDDERVIDDVALLDREIVDVEFEEIYTTHDRPFSCSDD